MNNTHRAEQVIQGLVDHPETPEIVAQALADAGLLAPEPQIIRTLTDLEALDPDTTLVDSAGPYTAGDAVDAIYENDDEDRDYLPAAVIATGDQTRAARQALAEANREPETGDFHSSIGLWQPRPPATWEKE